MLHISICVFKSGQHPARQVFFSVFSMYFIIVLLAYQNKLFKLLALWKIIRTAEFYETPIWPELPLELGGVVQR